MKISNTQRHTQRYDINLYVYSYTFACEEAPKSRVKDPTVLVKLDHLRSEKPKFCISGFWISGSWACGIIQGFGLRVFGVWGRFWTEAPQTPRQQKDAAEGPVTPRFKTHEPEQSFLRLQSSDLIKVAQ